MWLGQWVVEGLVVTAAIALLLRARPRWSASTRGLVLWSALLTVAVLPWLPSAVHLVGVTLSGSLHLSPAGTGGAGIPGLPEAAATVASRAATRAFALAEVATPMLVIVWAVSTTTAVGRLMMGLLTLRRWRSRCQPLSAEVLERLPVWTRLQGQGRQARVVVSRDVTSPSVLGLWTPLIALPPSALALERATLDAVLVHEHAHVQRRDDIAQLVQHVIGACLVMHPAVWWISRMLTVEREAACDDWVVLLAASRRQYATCLLDVAGGGRGWELLPVNMDGGRSQLAHRIRRLVDGRRLRQLRTSWGTRVVVPIGVALAAGVVAGITASVTGGLVGPSHASQSDRDEIAGVTARVVSQRVVPPERPRATSPAAAPSTSARHDAWHGIRSRTPALEGDVSRAARRPNVPIPGERLDAGRAPSVMLGRPGPVAVAMPPGNLASVPVNVLALSRPIGHSPESAPDTSASSARSRTPWGDATSAGVALGEASALMGTGLARGGAATGGFFARLGKRVARSF